MSEADSTSHVEYRPIPGFPGYYAGNDGTIWSSKRSRDRHLRQLQPCTNDGYHYVCLASNKKTSTKAVHRLVLLTFVGPCPKGHECRHIDGNPSNNIPSNLAWGTRQEQAADKKRHGTVRQPKGHKHGMAKLTDEEVAAIRRLAENGVPFAHIASQYPVTPKTIGNIAKGRGWKHLPCPESVMPVMKNWRNVKLSADDVVEIRRLDAVGVPQKEIARRFAVSQPNISSIVNRKSWAHVP